MKRLEESMNKTFSFLREGGEKVEQMKTKLKKKFSKNKNKIGLKA